MAQLAQVQGHFTMTKSRPRFSLELLNVFVRVIYQFELGINTGSVICFRFGRFNTVGVLLLFVLGFGAVTVR